MEKSARLGHAIVGATLLALVSAVARGDNSNALYEKYGHFADQAEESQARYRAAFHDCGEHPDQHSDALKLGLRLHKELATQELANKEFWNELGSDTEVRFVLMARRLEEVADSSRQLLQEFEGCQDRYQQFLDDALPCRGGYLASTLEPGDVELIRVVRGLNVAYARKDLKRFCEWNRMATFFQEKKPGSKEEARFQRLADRGAEKEAVDLFFRTFQAEVVGDHWLTSLTGAPALKSLDLNHLDICAGLCGPPKTLAEIKRIFSEDLSPPEKLNPLELSPTSEFKPVGRIKTLGLCGYLSISDSIGCSSALERNIDSMLPVGVKDSSSEVTAREELQTVITDPRYTRALRSLIPKLIERLEDPVMSKSANLFDDLKTAFAENPAGLGKKETEKAVWTVLAALAAGGPNIDVRVLGLPEFSGFADKKNPNAAALATIAMLIPLLDTAKIEQAEPSLYSLPGNVAFPCDSGKTYHFWMSAYLAWKQRQAGASTGAATAAAFAANVGYQLAADTRDVDKSQLLRLPRFNATENSMRIDMTLAAAGAVFGGEAASGKRADGRTVDLGDAFVQYLMASGTRPSLGQAPASLPGGIRVFTRETSEDLRWVDNLRPRWIYRHLSDGSD